MNTETDEINIASMIPQNDVSVLLGLPILFSEMAMQTWIFQLEIPEL